MISINNLTVSFGGFTLLDNVGFHISEADKIGLVGKNGAGKSTLMKLILGTELPTSGRIDRPSHVRIGYLPQIMQHSKGRTVMEEVLTVFEEISRIEAQVDEINALLAERTDYGSDSYNELISSLSSMTDLLSMEGSEPKNVRAERILTGLGFRQDDFGRPVETFSQGWNMRIELAKILLSAPDVLLLDEPTNHLDIESIGWLEDYLKSYKGSLLLVSHDRRFLDNVTNRTVEIMLGKIYDYKVPYSQYIALRKERMAQQTAAYENQQRMIEKTEDFIARFRYKPTKSNQVQSRIKALDKLERIEVDETDNARLTVKFPPAPRSGDVVFKAEDLQAGYPGKVVFSGASIEIKRGEKVALVGRNGEGKTTLMRIVTGQLAPIGGQARTGHNVHIGYYAQNQEDILDPSETVFGTLDRIAVGEIRMKLRDILAQFLFRGEDIDKKVSVLSGGERARLGMAGLMLKPYNLLALDEPTNHMDIKSKDILKQALQAYDGTLLIVSHDRDFLDGLAGKIYEFRDGLVREYLGGVQDFLDSRKLESLADLETGNVKQEEEAGVQERGGHDTFMQRKAVTKEERRLRNRAERLEKEISSLESAMSEIEKVLSAPGPEDDVMELTRTYLEHKREVDFKTEEWGQLLEEIEKY